MEYEDLFLICQIEFQALSDEANELLPIFNKASSRHYQTSIPAADWSSGNNGSPFPSRLSSFY